MKLYLVSQEVNNDYDTYNSFVVACETKAEARITHPIKEQWDGTDEQYSSWCSVDDVKVSYIGEAKKGTQKGIILSSFNAG